LFLKEVSAFYFDQISLQLFDQKYSKNINTVIILQ